MRVIQKLGREDIAIVYVAQSDKGHRIEFVESVEPPIPHEQKWVNIISTLYGCPVGCSMCDAGIHYRGKLSREELLYQIDYLVDKRFPDRTVPVDKWKIQFARMGDPAFNMNVIDVLNTIPERYDAPGFMPSISTVAPKNTDRFFSGLLEASAQYHGRFQFQFSIHSTDPDIRRKLIPIDCMSFAEMAQYGEKFYLPGGRKITLNFVMMESVPVDSKLLRKQFNSDIFLIKITPLNPTYTAKMNELASCFSQDEREMQVVNSLRDEGYEVIVSQGELEENAIGSNCGQFVAAMDRCKADSIDAYLYESEQV